MSQLQGAPVLELHTFFVKTTGVFLFSSGCSNTYVFFCSEDLEKDVEFEVVGDTPEKVGPKPSEPTSKNITNGSDDGVQPSTSTGKYSNCY